MIYNTSINTGGFGQGIPAETAALRDQPQSSLMDSLFNLSPYQKGRMNPQQTSEMSRQFDDTNRAARWNAANDLDRSYNAANQQMKMAQLGSASNNAMNFFGNASNQQNQRQQLAMGLMRSLFGG